MVTGVSPPLALRMAADGYDENGNEVWDDDEEDEEEDEAVEEEGGQEGTVEVKLSKYKLCSQIEYMVVMFKRTCANAAPKLANIVIN